MKTGSRSGRSSATSSLTARPMPIQTISPLSVHKALWSTGPRGTTVVAVDGDRVLGAATIGPNRPGRGSHVATASFMVSPASRGRGVGRRLGEYALQWAADAGFKAMQFNAVVDTNTCRRRVVGVARVRDHRHRARGIRLTEPRSCRAARDVPPPPIGGIRERQEGPCDRAKSGIATNQPKVESMTLNFVVAKSISLAHS